MMLLPFQTFTWKLYYHKSGIHTFYSFFRQRKQIAFNNYTDMLTSRFWICSQTLERCYYCWMTEMVCWIWELAGWISLYLAGEVKCNKKNRLQSAPMKHPIAQYEASVPRSILSSGMCITWINMLWPGGHCGFKRCHIRDSL